MRSRATQIAAALVAIAIGALSFVYRFNTLGGPLAGFDNDHFAQLARSIAFLHGERPIKDFTDTDLRALWPALTYSTSAAAQQVLGHSLRSEALMTIGMLSVGAATLFWASASIAQALLPAVWATLLAVGLSPALYNYPKIVPYVLAIIAMLAYSRRSTTGRLIALGLALSVAALYRHDHGVFLGLASGTLILTRHARHAWKPLLIVIGVVVVCFLPGIIFAQTHGGFVNYLRKCLEITRQEVARTVEPSPEFRIDWSQPLLMRGDSPPPPKPRIAVRWAPGITPEARARAEQELRLADAVRRDDDWNWSYTIEALSSERLAAIVADRRVLDTDGIDRQNFALTSTPAAPAAGWRARSGLLGWRIAPGVLTDANAAPWLYFMGWSVIVAAIACVSWPPLRRAVVTPAVPLPVVAAISLLGALIFVALLRNPAPFRLPDASVPIVVLGAWLLAVIPRAARSQPRGVRRMISLVLVVLAGLTTLAVGAVGEVGQQTAAAGITEGPDGLRRRWIDVWDMLGALPDSTQGIDADLGRTARYLRRCTLGTDRVLVGDNLPEVYYFAERGFAAGQFSFFSNFYSSDEFQREAIDRWSRQSVPIALMQPPERFDQEFGSDYRLLADYLRAHYRRVGSLMIRRGTVLDVWVDARRDGHRDSDTGLPCFGE